MVSGTACGDGGAGAPDARASSDASPSADSAASADAFVSPYDLSCAETPWPTTAPANLTWAGRVYDSAGLQAIVGAALEVRSIADDAVLDSGTSDSSGGFSFSLATGGEAIAVYVHATASGYLPSSTYPPYALWADQPSRSVWMLAAADGVALTQAAGVEPAAGTGIVMARLNDCAVPAAQVAGATVTFAPAAPATAQLDGTTWNAGNTTTGDGIVAGVNVPAGSNDVTVGYAGSNWRSWPIKSVADGFVYTPRRP